LILLFLSTKIEIIMKNSDELLKILSKFVESGILTSKDIKKEILTNFEFKKDDIFEKLKIVTREEFEILKLTIQKQDKEIKNLTKKLKLKR
jgi:BMFP domain-containing protein YqiC